MKRTPKPGRQPASGTQPPSPPDTPQFGLLDFLQSPDQSFAAAENEPYRLSLDFLSFHAWLGQAVLGAMAEFANNKSARDRRMQTGQAWRAFEELFGDLTVLELLTLYSNLLCFAASAEHPAASVLLQAFRPLKFEYDAKPDALTLNAPLKEPAQAAAHLRTILHRLADWLDAIIHLQTLDLWHVAPCCFDPDPEKRDLALLGLSQRHLAKNGEPIRAMWNWLHAQAAERFKDSPKWPTIGRAMASDELRPWPYREADTAIISLWPLLKRHNWTYRDLLSVVLALTSSASSAPKYPFRSDQEFAAHCTMALGLRKQGVGKTSKDGRPPGYDIALRLFGVSSK